MDWLALSSLRLPDLQNAYLSLFWKNYWSFRSLPAMAVARIDPPASPVTADRFGCSLCQTSLLLRTRHILTVWKGERPARWGYNTVGISQSQKFWTPALQRYPSARQITQTLRLSNRPNENKNPTTTNTHRDPSAQGPHLPTRRNHRQRQKPHQCQGQRNFRVNIKSPYPRPMARASPHTAASKSKDHSWAQEAVKAPNQAPAKPNRPQSPP